MKKMVIFDPAMCCPTGVCGPSVDKEILRVATIINRLQKKGILIERHNLTNNPQIFVDNQVINKLLNDEGVDILPVTMIDGEIVKTKEYPTNEDFVKMLEIPKEYIMSELGARKAKKQNNNCCRGKGCC